eukprot:g9634.t1
MHYCCELAYEHCDFRTAAVSCCCCACGACSGAWPYAELSGLEGVLCCMHATTVLGGSCVIAEVMKSC